MTRDFDDWQAVSNVRLLMSLPERVTEIEKQVKEFDKWRDTKPLESILKELMKSYDNLNHKVKELEELGRNSHNSNYIRIGELEDKVEKLEQWKLDAPSLSRLEKLEEWSNNIKLYLPSVESIRDKVKALEEWKLEVNALDSEHERRIKKLEEWRNNPPTRLSLLETQIMQLEESRADDLKRIVALEGWKQGHQNNWHGKDAVDAIHEFNSKKHIDKQVWEDIKCDIENIYSQYDNSSHPYGVDTYPLTRLVESIKKVDPTWNPKWEPDKK